jgi:hypothetical protein
VEALVDGAKKKVNQRFKKEKNGVFTKSLR